MITKKERDELLEGLGLSEEELKVIFSELKIDYESDGFDESEIERIEATAIAMGLAVQKIKRLVAATPDASLHEAIAIQQSQILVGELESQDIHLPMDFILSSAMAKIEMAVALSDGVHGLVEKAYQRREKENQKKFVEKAIASSRHTLEVIEELLENDDSVQGILDTVVPQSRLNGQVQSFMNIIESKRKAREQIEGQRQQEQKALPPQNPQKFLGAFLASMKGGDRES
jgi:hypothetical protein